MSMTLPEHAVVTIHTFIQDHVRAAGGSGVVVGVSGGLDSAVVLKLAVDALGPDGVVALLMPEAPEGVDLEDARTLCKDLGVRFEIIPIGPLVDALGCSAGVDDPRVLGNIKARVRMCLLYAVANEEERIVLGTSNKSELLVGYFTKWGDGGSDYLPIGDLYKTQVRQLAREIGVPGRFIEKAPSAGLVPGQTDEGDLGMTYETLDRILRGIEMRMTPEEISEREGVPIEDAIMVRGMVRDSIHKRRLPLVLKLGARTVGRDWRE